MLRDYLREQDTIITAQEELALLNRQIVELEAKVSRERDKSKTPSLEAGSPRFADCHYLSKEADDDTLLASHDVGDLLPHSHPASIGAGMPPSTADAPATPGANSAPLHSDTSPSDTAQGSSHPRCSARHDDDSAPPYSDTCTSNSEAALDSTPSRGCLPSVYILQYHASNESWRGGKRSVRHATESPPENLAGEDKTSVATESASDKPRDIKSADHPSQLDYFVTRAG